MEATYTFNLQYCTCETSIDNLFTETTRGLDDGQSQIMQQEVLGEERGVFQADTSTTLSEFSALSEFNIRCRFQILLN